MLEISVKRRHSVGDVFEIALLLSNLWTNEFIEASKQCLVSIRKRLFIFKEASPSSIGKHISDLILTVNPEKGLRFLEEAGVLAVVLPELSACVGVEQNKKYHIDDVFTHCIKVCSLTDYNLALKWAGLLHDIGKKEAYNKKENGSITFHKHEVYSAKLAEKVLNRLCPGQPFVEEACSLVALHMYYYSSAWTDKAIRRFLVKTKINKKDCKRMGDVPLFKLRCADRASRGLQQITPKQQAFELRLKKFLCE